MSIVKDRITKIAYSLPNNYFDDMSYTDIGLALMKEYLDRYGEDETTLIPGTDKHLSIATLREILGNDGNL